MSEQPSSKKYLSANRLEIIKQSPRQADVTDVEDMCDEIERLQRELVESTRHAREVEDEYRQRMGHGFGTAHEPPAAHPLVSALMQAVRMERDEFNETDDASYSTEAIMLSKQRTELCKSAVLAAMQPAQPPPPLNESALTGRDNSPGTVADGPAGLALPPDTARLDFLEDDGRCYWVDVQRQPDGKGIFAGQGKGLRAAIDQAIRDTSTKGL